MVKSRSEYPDPEIYAAQKEIRRRYNAVLSELIRTIKSAEVRDMLNRFRDVLDEPKIDPYGKLPINSRHGLSTIWNKRKCLLCTISQLVQRNWDFNRLENFNYAEKVKHALTFLESITEKGLDAFEIKGKKFPGYYLSEVK